MSRGLFCLTLLGLAGLVQSASVSGAAEASAPRVAPTRPGSLPVTRVANVDYVGVADIARSLGMSGDWVVRDRAFRITGNGERIELTVGSREIEIGGRRLFLGQPLLLRNRELHMAQVDYERALLPLLEPTLAGLVPARPRVIVLDPGHGGEDPGMENASHSLKEKDLTLDVALRLKRLLEADGYRVVLTRTDDRQLGETKTADFRRRTEIANTAGAELFVSIHFNSLGSDTRTGGTEVFVFSRQGQRSDQSWNTGEDDTEPAASAVNRHDPWSVLLGHRVLNSVIAKLGTDDRGLKTMHSAVLRGLNCPGILVESLFLSNPIEAARVSRPDTREFIAEALRDGIRAYGAALLGTEG